MGLPVFQALSFPITSSAHSVSTSIAMETKFSPSSVSTAHQVHIILFLILNNISATKSFMIDKKFCITVKLHHHTSSELFWYLLYKSLSLGHLLIFVFHPLRTLLQGCIWTDYLLPSLGLTIDMILINWILEVILTNAFSVF